MPWSCWKGSPGTLRDDVPLLPDDPATPLAQDIHSNQQGTQAHCNPHCQRQRRCRRAASSASRAGLARSGQGACHPATGRGDKGTEPLLFAECSVGGGAAQLHCAGALGHCEPAALDAGCSLQRSSGAELKGALRRELVLAAEAGAEPGAVGIGQRLNARQTETGGLGRWLSNQHLVPIHQNPYAIALALRLCSFSF